MYCIGVCVFVGGGGVGWRRVLSKLFLCFPSKNQSVQAFSNTIKYRKPTFIRDDIISRMTLLIIKMVCVDKIVLHYKVYI